MEEKIRVLVVEPNKAPRECRITNDLDHLQLAVGGMIEALYPFEDDVAIICNEEGKLLNLPLNRCLKNARGEVYDIISGTFLLCGLTEDGFGSLSDTLLKKYSSYYENKERFLYVNQTLYVISEKTD